MNQIVKDTTPRVLQVGIVITSFTMESFEVVENRLVALGKLEVRQFGQPTPLTWWASAEFSSALIFPWEVRKNRSEPSFGSDQNLSMLLKKFITNFLAQHCRDNPVKARRPVAAVEVKAVMQTTSYPDNWASRYAARNGQVTPVEVKAPPLKKSLPPVEKPKLPRKRQVAPKVNGSTMPDPVISKPAVYRGPFNQYAGKCVCAELYESTSGRGFDWFRRTGGMYASRCFECSCGAMWWEHHPNDHFWIQVKDTALWWMLLSNDGVPKQQIAYVIDAAYLRSTLIHRGMPESDYVLHRGT